MTNIYQFSLVRFRPFAETGEFANIGVVVLNMSTGAITYELAPKRFPRIKGFFDPATHEAYTIVIELLEVELARSAEFLPDFGGKAGKSIFDDLIRRRESSIIFGEPRAIQAEGGQTVVTERLFSRFIKRDFTAVEPAETVLTKDIRLALRQNGIKYFRSLRIVDDVVPVQFPLAVDDGAIHAIRPLAFSQKSPMAIFDHGAHWRRRLDYLLEKGTIREGNVLLAVEEPTLDYEAPVWDAFKLAMDELKKLPFNIVQGETNGLVNPKIIEFAERVRPYQHRLMH